MKTGLVIEGGGMRGVFTAGVLDFFLDNDVRFDSCIGVSAGACQACSYLSKQKKRGYRTMTDFLDDKRFCGVRSMIKTGDMFGVQFSYDEVPNKLLPFDYDAFLQSETKLQAVITNCQTGKAEYPVINDLKDDMRLIRASSSLPFVSKKVEIDGKYYLDGGISDSIPVKQIIKQGCKKPVVIMTREREYRKKANKHIALMKAYYVKYPLLIRTMKKRYIVYNETVEYIYEQERQGNIFVIQPEKSLGLRRTEKNISSLEKAYESGYQTAKNSYEGLKKFL